MNHEYFLRYIKLIRANKIWSLWPWGDGYKMAPYKSAKFVNDMSSAEWISFKKTEELIEVLEGVEELQNSLILSALRKDVSSEISNYLMGRVRA